MPRGSWKRLSWLGRSEVGVRAGDVVWFSPDEKHWHGVRPNTAMTHIAIQEEQDGAAVAWLAHVTDEEYDPDRQLSCCGDTWADVRRRFRWFRFPENA